MVTAADAETSGHPLERRWGHGSRPLPRRALVGSRSRSPIARTPLDFTLRMTRLCADIAARCPVFGQFDSGAVLQTWTPSRTRSQYGLQARVTPMRFRDGALTRKYRGVVYQVQRYHVDGREMLYLMTFCLPRFLDQSFEEKLITVVHEMYHIGERFDGDIRRHPGRYAVHSHSKGEYDRRMAGIVHEYLRSEPDQSVYAWLRPGCRDMLAEHGSIVGVYVPRPKLIPVG